MSPSSSNSESPSSIPRRRPKQLSAKTMQKDSDSESNVKRKSSAVESKAAVSESASSATPGRHSHRPVTLILAVLCVLGLSLLIRRRPSSLPKTYALCSREGNIYTVDDINTRTECIVVHHSQILSVGTLDETRKRFGDAEKTGPVANALRLRAFKNGLKFYFVEPGHIVVPGLADAHAHLIEQGFKRNLEVDHCSSVSEVLEKVVSYINARPDILGDKNVWIQGMGWDQTKWGNKGIFPAAADFDSEPLLRGRPIVLRRVDGHAIWVSPRVLKESSDLPDSIEGGEIVRDSDGQPTGIFVDNAMSLITPPPWTDKQMLEFYITAVKEALSYGLTSVHNADTSLQMINFLKKVADADKLPLRLYLMGNVRSNEHLERFINYGPAGRLTLRSVKLFSDGALGSWGAAMLEPYADRPDSKGFLLQSPEAMSKLVQNFWNDDFQVNIHCIGDLANSVVLDIFEDLLRGEIVSDRRPRIEHAQIVAPADLERMGRLGAQATCGMLKRDWYGSIDECKCKKDLFADWECRAHSVLSSRTPTDLC
ncbi:hypothetical protein EW145_g3049 [Phellinidium pouzarii]|uniref:Amidohydrolase 3 domain-containing protein n=1 Tax=Phellinidium pouzarii TaxID=167371 RepID=A0A4S4L8S8_9AGAM|nr:hypothetical protein EW145_g3049 [Phellinidium pouzarii]